MKKKHIYSVIIVLISLSCLYVLYNKMFSREETTTINFVVPSPNVSPSSDFSDSLIILTNENVQDVLKTLITSSDYYRIYNISDYYGDKQNDTVIGLYSKGENIRISEEFEDTIKNTLLIEDMVYVWYEDDKSDVYSSNFNESMFSKTQLSRLLNYQELLGVDKGQIIEAKYETFEEEPCIFIKYYSADNRYVNEIHVSISNGLLKTASVYKDDVLIHTMTSLSTTIGAVDVGLFTVPSQK